MNRRDRAPPAYSILPEGERLPAAPFNQRTHDRLNFQCITGSYALRIVTASPLHVGSGLSSIHTSKGNYPILARGIVTNREGDHVAPVIPGSSIKGSVRNLVEAFGGGCQLDHRYCDPPCRVCSIFGHIQDKGGYLSRAAFDEARLETPEDADRIDCIQGPIPREPDWRFPRGRRIYGRPPELTSTPVPYVVVNTLTPFLTRLVVRNLTEEELGLVLLGLGADGTFNLRLGGGKFVGFGRVQVQVTGARLRHGYKHPAPEILDAVAAFTRARAAMDTAEQRLTPKGARSLLEIRDVLGATP